VTKMIPKVELENLKLSRMVIGTNQFNGITHRPNAFEIFKHKRFFRESTTVAKFMIHLVQEHGLNCLVSSPRDKMYDAIKLTEKETGTKLYWICTPSRRHTVKGLPGSIYEQIDWCADHEVAVCMPHRDYTDNAIDKKNLTIGGNSGFEPYPEVAAYIRDKKMIPGLSTHYIESIEAVEKNKYDAPLIIQPLNKIGFESDCAPDVLAAKIKSTKIKILSIKPMAAGRISPEEGLPWAVERLKKDDLIAVGTGDKFQYCIHDGKLMEDLLNKKNY
jgi:hypothetical protein